MAGAGKRIATVGEINEHLPFMLGDAEMDPRHWDFVIDDPACSTALVGRVTFSLNPEHGASVLDCVMVVILFDLILTMVFMLGRLIVQCSPYAHYGA